jgi:hypothetical protein
MSPLAELTLLLYAAALTASALTVAYVWVILYLAIHGNYRARVIAALMTAGCAALVLWAATR